MHPLRVRTLGRFLVFWLLAATTFVAGLAIPAAGHAPVPPPGLAHGFADWANASPHTAPFSTHVTVDPAARSRSNAATGAASLVSSSPLNAITALGTQSPKYSEETLSLLNGTLLPGNASTASGNGVTVLTYDPLTRLFFAEGVYTDSVVIVNASDDRVQAGFTPGNSPSGIAVDGANHTVYVASYYSNTLTVADTTTGAIRATIAVGTDPDGVALDLRDHRVFVADAGSNNVSVIDALNDSVVATVQVGTHPEQIRYLYLNSTGRVYVANYLSANVTEINASSLSKVRTIPVGSHPQAPVYDPSSNQLYIANVGSSNLTILNATTNAQRKTLAMPGVGYGVQSMAINPRGDRVFVLGNGNVRVFNGSNDSIVSTTGVSGFAFAIASDPANGNVYVADGASNNVSILNGTNGSVVATVPSYYTPDGVAFDPVRTEMWIAEQGSSNISIINGTTEKTTGSFPVAYAPFLVGAGPANGTVFVDGACRGGIAEVNGSSGRISSCIDFPARPVGLTYDSQNGMLYVSDDYTTVYVVNPTNGTIAHSIFLGDSPYPPYPWEMALDPANNTLFVPTYDWGNLSVINLTTDKVVRVLGAGGGSVATYDPADGSIWISTWANKVLRYNASTYKALPSVAVGTYAEGMVYDPLTREMYIANSGSQNVSVLNATTGAMVATVKVGINNYQLAYDPYDDLIFCTNAGSNTVSVIDGTNHSVVATVPTEFWPRDVAFSNTGDLAVISDQDGSALTLLQMHSPPGPRIEKFAADPAVVPEGGSTNFTSSVIDPNGTPSYAYLGLPVGCTSSNTSRLGCTPGRPGSYLVTLRVTDPAGYSADANVTLVAEDNLTVPGFRLSSPAIDLNQSIRLNTTATGGYGAVTYTYTGLPPGCPGLDVAQLTCTPTAPGNFTVTVWVTDQSGGNRSASALLDVNPDPRMSSLQFSNSTIDVNQSTTLSTRVAGGTAPFSYTYSGLPQGCSTRNAADLACSPSVAFNSSVRVEVRDSAGMAVNASAPLQVNPRPHVEQVSAAPDPVENGTSTEITILWSGGSAPFTFRYVGLPSGCGSTSLAAIACSPSATGNFTITGEVTDSRGVISTGQVLLRVVAAPAVHSILVSSFRATVDPVLQGLTAELVVGATGDVSQLNYTYHGLPQGCRSENTSTLNCTPSVAGTFNVSVTVRDIYRQTAIANLTLVVTPAAGTSPPIAHTSPASGIPWAWAAVVLAVVVTAGLLATILVSRRRRRRGPTEGASASIGPSEIPMEDSPSELASPDAERSFGPSEPGGE